MGFWSSLQETLSSFFQGIVDQLKAAYDKAKEFFSYIYDKCKAAILWVWKQVSGFFFFAGDLVSDTLRKTLNSIKSLKTQPKKLKIFLSENAYTLVQQMSCMFKCKQEVCDLIISIMKPVLACLPEIGFLTRFLGFFEGGSNISKLCHEKLEKVKDNIAEDREHENVVEHIEDIAHAIDPVPHQSG